MRDGSPDLKIRTTLVNFSSDGNKHSGVAFSRNGSNVAKHEMVVKLT